MMQINITDNCSIVEYTYTDTSNCSFEFYKYLTVCLLWYSYQPMVEYPMS